MVRKELSSALKTSVRNAKGTDAGCTALSDTQRGHPDWSPMVPGAAVLVICFAPSFDQRRHLHKALT